MATYVAATARGRRLLLVAAFVCVLALPTAADAQWRARHAPCASFGAASGCTAIPSAFNGAWTVTISPDGKHAYAAAWVDDGGGLHVFDRNPTTGALTYKACYVWVLAIPRCTPVSGMARPDSVIVSANGLNVYVTGWRDDANTAPAVIKTFTRVPATGALTQTGCINDDGSEDCSNGLTVGGHGAILSRDRAEHLRPRDALTCPRSAATRRPAR